QMGRITKGRNCEVFRMCRKGYPKERSGSIEIKLWARRTILLHDPEDLRDTGAASLGQAEFLENLTDATIPCWNWRKRFAGLEMLGLDSGYRSRIANNLHTVRI